MGITYITKKMAMNKSNELHVSFIKSEKRNQNYISLGFIEDAVKRLYPSRYVVIGFDEEFKKMYIVESDENNGYKICKSSHANKLYAKVLYNDMPKNLLGLSFNCDIKKDYECGLYYVDIPDKKQEKPKYSDEEIAKLVAEMIKREG